jgi:hypothetical protein
MALTPEQIKAIQEETGIAPASTALGDDYFSNEAINQRAREFDAAVNEGKDERSAETYSAIAPAKTGEGPLKAGLKATANVPSSAYSLGKGVVEAVRHPIATGEGIIRTAKGGVKKLGDTLVEKTKLGDIKASNGATLRENIQKLQPDIDEKTFNAVIDSLHERYGSLENAQRTATNDPFGFGADVMSVLSGVGGLARGIAPETTEAVSRAAKILTQPVADVRTAARAKVAGTLEKSAQKNIEKILEPTKEAMKVQTKQILPDLTKTRPKAMTTQGLADQFAANADISGEAIDTAWKALPKGTRENVKPILDSMEKTKNSFIVDGTIVDENSWKAAEEIQKVILDISKGEDTVPSESLRKVRQIWDESIAKSRGFTRDLSEQDKLAIKKQATGAIRKVLSDAHPDIAALNKEYTLWRKASDIIDETIKRKTGQKPPLSSTLKSVGGGVIGGNFGLKDAAIGAGIIATITFATKSTLWKTLSAATKSRLAEAIFEANPAKIGKILRPIIGDQAFKLINDSKEE